MPLKTRAWGQQLKLKHALALELRDFSSFADPLKSRAARRAKLGASARDVTKGHAAAGLSCWLLAAAMRRAAGGAEPEEITTGAPAQDALACDELGG